MELLCLVETGAVFFQAKSEPVLAEATSAATTPPIMAIKGSKNERPVARREGLEASPTEGVGGDLTSEGSKSGLGPSVP